MEIVQWLSRPDPQLLKWSEEDTAVHPRASLLGAELEAAEDLYKDLQGAYMQLASPVHSNDSISV